MHIQLPFLGEIHDLFQIHPLSFVGVTVIIVALVSVLRKDTNKRKIVTTIATLVLFCYTLFSLTYIFGIPSLKDFIRLRRVGESLYNPNIEWLPLADGFSLSFILNIFVFVPIGFLIPLISPSFRKLTNTMLLGALFSLSIEISQLFTLYRATDVNDLMTNTLGTAIGYVCFSLCHTLFSKNKKQPSLSKTDKTKILPIVALMTAFLNAFLIVY